MARQFTNTELEAFLDESLEAAEMAALEGALRTDAALIERLAAINARRDSGDHSLGEIWRRQQVSCPTREQLGRHLLGAVDEGLRDYITFHIEQIGCRFCQANLDDLRRQQSEGAAGSAGRRRKYFQSSAGYFSR